MCPGAAVRPLEGFVDVSLLPVTVAGKTASKYMVSLHDACFAGLLEVVMQDQRLAAQQVVPPTLHTCDAAQAVIGVVDVVQLHIIGTRHLGGEGKGPGGMRAQRSQ